MDEQLPAEPTQPKNKLKVILSFLSLLVFLGILTYIGFIVLPKSNLNKYLPFNLGITELPETKQATESTQSSKSAFGNVIETPSTNCSNLILDEDKLTKGLFLDYDSVQRLIKVDYEVYPELYIVGTDTTQIYSINEDCKTLSLSDFSSISENTPIALQSSTRIARDGIILFNTVPVENAKLLIEESLVIYVYK